MSKNRDKKDQDAYTVEMARQVRSLRNSTTRIGHGAAALDPTVQNGRNARVREHNSGDILSYGENEEEGREAIQQAALQQEFVDRAVRRQVEETYDGLVHTAGKDADVPLKHTYIDADGSCKALPDTAITTSTPSTSFAKTAELPITNPDATPTTVLNADIKHARRSFESVTKGQYANPLASIETYRPGDVPAYAQTTIGTDLGKDIKSASFATLSDGQSFTPMNGIEATPLNGFNDHAKKGMKPAAPKLQLVDHKGPAPETGLTLNGPTFNMFGS